MAKTKTKVPELEPKMPPYTSPNPPAIAYKVASSKIQELISPPSTELSDYKLIGLQIEFKEEEKNMSVPKIVRLYFNSDQTEGSYFKRVDTLFKLRQGHTKSVVINPGEIIEEVQEQAWSSLGNFNPPNVVDTFFTYKKLDFFYENIDLVYFPLGLLRTLTYLFDDLIISGCQLKMGRKLYHRPPSTDMEDDPKIFDESYFSLKIEGANNNSANNKLETDAYGSGVVIGHPCPPKWETFTAITNEIATHYSDVEDLRSKIKDIRADWEKNVYRVVGGKEDAIDIDQT